MSEVLHNGIVLPATWPPVVPTIGDVYDPSVGTPWAQGFYSIPDPIDITTGRQSLVDDFLVEATDMVRAWHQPTKELANPVLSPEPDEIGMVGSEMEEHSFTNPGGVWWDVIAGEIRVWYDAINRIAMASGPSILALARPTTAYGDNDTRGIEQRSAWVGLDIATPGAIRDRYLAMNFANAKRANAYTSPDGVTFQHVVAGPYYVTDPDPPNSFDGDKLSAYYDPFRGAWVANLKDRVDRTGATPAGTDNDRVRRYAEGATLAQAVASINNPPFWIATDAYDPPFDHTLRPTETEVNPRSQVYGSEHFAWEAMMIGLYTNNRSSSSYALTADGNKMPKWNEPFFSWSRDGFYYMRPPINPRIPFIPIGEPDDWDEGNVQASGGIPHLIGPATDELMVFAFAARREEYVGGVVHEYNQTGAAYLRRGGFASLDADNTQRTLTTRPLRFDHADGYLFVNADVAGGSLEVRVLDAADDSELVGWSDAVALDATKQAITWSSAQSSLAALSGARIKLQFRATNCELYEFWIAPTTAGTSEGWIGAGPNYSDYRDTINPRSFEQWQPGGGGHRRVRGA